MVSGLSGKYRKAVWWIQFFSTQKNHLQLLNTADVGMHLGTRASWRQFPIEH
jgi:hypothetical protein